MRHLPVFLRVRGRKVLVVGGAPRAAAKLALLGAAGARPVVIAPAVCGEIAAGAADGRIRHERRLFEPSDVADCAVVIAATGLPPVDTAVAEAARRAGVPVNVIDNAELSTFITPAIVDRDPVTVAISSGGASPALVRELRSRIDRMLPSRLGHVARFAERFRDTVKSVVGDYTARRRLWDEIIGGPIADAVERGDEPGAAARMLALMNDHVAGPNPPGTVYLVGAGPGDPDLLTLRAIRALQRADVVVHDRLVGSGILEMARRDAERIYVGKEKSGHAMTQAGINALLAARAEAGDTVVRLKGGDPFVFGRGGEELEYLRQRGISVQVVPGISAAAGCAAAAGIPLTHRDLASSVTFVSGHAKDGVPRLDWPALAQGRQTIVVYMGVTTAPLIARRLIAHGLAPGTPVAVVENGTLPDQRVLTGNLRDLATLISANRVTAPALIIIGEVVALSNAAAPSLAQADAASSVAQSAAAMSVAV